MYEIKVLLNIFIFFLSSVTIVKTFIDLRKGYTYTFLFVYPIFYFFFILSFILKIFFGLPDYGLFNKVIYAFDDDLAVIIYQLLLLFSNIVFFFAYLHKKSTKKNIKLDLPSDSCYSRNSSKINIIENGLFFASFASLIVLLLQPKYFSLIISYGAAYLDHSIEKFPALVTGFTVMSSLIYLLISKRNFFKTSIVVFNIILSAILRASRASIFVSIFFICVALIMSKKAKPKIVINVLLLCIPILLMFAFAYHQIFRSGSTNFYNYFAVDLSRDYTTIYAIHCELTNNMILNYRFETIIAMAIFFIPRILMPFKPYPFAQYITSNLIGLPINDVGSLGWGTTTSLPCEFIANMGLFGIPIFIFVVQLAINVIDKIKTIEIRFVALYCLFMLFTVEFQAFAVSIFVFMIYYLLIFLIQKQYNKKRSQMDELSHT